MNIEEIKKLIIGKAISLAEQTLQALKVRYRIKSVDGVSNMMTCDYVEDRVNLTIKDGEIVDIQNG
jgi:hypothetical protein